MNKFVITTALGLIVSSAAFAQGSNTERNFQRLDKMTSKSESKEGGKFMQIAGNWQFPSNVNSYGVTGTYGSSLGCMKDGFWTSVSFMHNNPSGGAVSDTLGMTSTYQFGDEKMYNLTGGLTYFNNNSGFENLAPFVDATFMMGVMGSSFSLIPAITYDHMTIGGFANNGYVPDLMIAVNNSALWGVLGYVDLTPATTTAGTGTIQVGGTRGLDQKGQLNLKFAATFSKGSSPVFNAQVGFRF